MAAIKWQGWSCSVKKPDWSLPQIECKKGYSRVRIFPKGAILNSVQKCQKYGSGAYKCTFPFP